MEDLDVEIDDIEDEPELTAEEMRLEQERLRQKYSYKGQKKEKNLTSDPNVASSIAEFLPDSKKHRLERTIR